MEDYTFYSAILGLSSDWRIEEVTVDDATGITELHIRSQRAGETSCPTCGLDVPATGAWNARWLHENHLNIRFLISARIPVVTCQRCGEVKLPVPWDQSGPRPKLFDTYPQPAHEEPSPGKKAH